MITTNLLNLIFQFLSRSSKIALLVGLKPSQTQIMARTIAIGFTYQQHSLDLNILGFGGFIEVKRVVKFEIEGI